MVRSLSICAATVLLPGCGGDGSTSSAGGSDRADSFELVWSDEFEGAAGSGLDPAKWRFDVGGDGWGNQQLEYNSDRRENVALDGAGHLAITAREEAFEGNAYTSGRINTRGLFEQAFGRFEARIRLPEGKGIWPAFWLLGNNLDSVGWPACGEIDIMEFRGQHPAVVVGTVHGPGYAGGAGVGTEASIGGGLAGRFRLFAIEWDEAGIRWFVDDYKYHELTPQSIPTGTRWVFDHPFFILLNVAVGGGFVGSPPDQSTIFPLTMLVDYVRVYRKAGS
ncbi:MAG TPA: glycoside hydrolase family 16 protein [Candidatus Latescibacteria bacterium]|jgi:beta-glucanase (GH16 family)|nr:glycosyl hydrolase family 16 [Chloroflexota bacterium]MDP7364403.1 glycoside hydrolase family 16 protein [Candidatus Latescibacterota bacterium]HCV28729.1 glycosyl hydrolase family 16 [Dehalococcoidia bacterium]HJN27333.1 glycoside hydrolase family 16 protein [Candidatus Latescibacterota bacterium]|tara:strand:- start:111 stop:944 length:834 start_codon:yes stop_codon:yes gene_type:complete